MLTATHRHLRPLWLGSAADLPQNCRRTTQSAEKFPPLHAHPSQRSADGIELLNGETPVARRCDTRGAPVPQDLPHVRGARTHPVSIAASQGPG
jgi:hypothetical protein